MEVGLTTMDDKAIEERIVEAETKGKKERRAYVVLVCISILLSASVLMFGIYRANQNNHKFCDLFTFALTAQPAPKPPAVGADPKVVRAYEGYIKFRDLTRSLGCD